MSQDTICGELTPIQKGLLNWVAQFIRDQGYPPSQREMIGGVGAVGTAAFRDLILELRRKGLIDWQDGIPRSIKLLKPTLQKIEVLGSISAGPNATVFLDTSELLSLPQAQPGDFALYVQDDSLSGEMLLAGDTALFRKPGDEIPQGAIVAFQYKWSKDIKIRRYFRQQEFVQLKASNKAFLDLTFTPDEIDVLGTLIGVWRQY